MSDAGEPALRGELHVIATSTPDPLRRRCRNSGGAVHGWADTVLPSGSARLSHATPVRGLCPSGHRTRPGAGSLRVLAPGIPTASMVTSTAGESPPALQASSTLPPIS